MKKFKQFLNESLPKDPNQPEQTQLTPASSTGKAQFKTGDSDWQDVNGYVPQGAEIRTGMKSSVTLNPDTDTSTTMGSGQRKSAPKEGEDTSQFGTDTTTTQGKEDFKVDKVGLSNDFKVQKPSNSLGVRG
jgi:hypothetical protein